MGIVFHCEHCGKKIEAADNSGGKRCKCPACHNMLYVPGQEAGEGLKLSPEDEKDKTKQEQLMAETYKLRQDILLEREVPDAEGQSGMSASEISDKELTENIIFCLRQTADGQLKEAEESTDLISAYGQRAVEILDRIALSEIPELELADIPVQVLSGLIRELRRKIS